MMGCQLRGTWLFWPPATVERATTFLRNRNDRPSRRRGTMPANRTAFPINSAVVRSCILSLFLAWLHLGMADGQEIVSEAGTESTPAGAATTEVQQLVQDL